MFEQLTLNAARQQSQSPSPSMGLSLSKVCSSQQDLHVTSGSDTCNSAHHRTQSAGQRMVFPRGTIHRNFEQHRPKYPSLRMETIRTSLLCHQDRDTKSGKLALSSRRHRVQPRSEHMGRSPFHDTSLPHQQNLTSPQRTPPCSPWRAQHLQSAPLRHKDSAKEIVTSTPLVQADQGQRHSANASCDRLVSLLRGAENVGDAANAPAKVGDSCFATNSTPPISFLHSDGLQSSKNAGMKPQTACGNAAELRDVSHTTEQEALRLSMAGLRDSIHGISLNGQLVPGSLQVALSVLERGQDALEQTWATADALPRLCDA